MQGKVTSGGLGPLGRSASAGGPELTNQGDATVCLLTTGAQVFWLAAKMASNGCRQTIYA